MLKCVLCIYGAVRCCARERENGVVGFRVHLAVTSKGKNSL